MHIFLFIQFYLGHFGRSWVPAKAGLKSKGARDHDKVRLFMSSPIDSWSWILDACVTDWLTVYWGRSVDYIFDDVLPKYSRSRIKYQFDPEENFFTSVWDLLNDQSNLLSRTMFRLCWFCDLFVDVALTGNKSQNKVQELYHVIPSLTLILIYLLSGYFISGFHCTGRRSPSIIAPCTLVL